MKYMLTVVLMSFSCLLFHAQVAMNTFAKDFQLELRNQIPDAPSQDVIDRYDLIQINGTYYIGVLALVDLQTISEMHLTNLGVINDTRLEQLWSFRVPLTAYFEFLETPGLNYIEIGEPIDPFLDKAILDARVDSVHQGLGDLTRAYSGKGVVVAVIDWGFDYTHPTFYDTSYNYLRIVRAWDQNKLSGPAPNGYHFGTEYIGKEALLQAGSDTNYVFGYSSHGTHVAGIAGGMGAGTPHGGAAWESDLIFISLRRDAPSLIDAFSYITNYAASVGKPYVVNMSFGSHLGPHDGTSLKNLGIDILHGPGKVFVGSAGNNGISSNNFHLDYDFSENPTDTLKTVVNFQNNPDQFGQTLSMWGSAFSDFQIAVAVVDNSNTILYQTPFYLSSTEPWLNDTILYGANDDSLIIRIQSTAQHFLNNKPNIRLELKRTAANHKVVLFATSTNSHLHMWNNVRMNNRYTNWGVALTSNYPNAVAGDNDYGLGEPAGVGKNVITVGSYRAELITGSGNILYGNISGFSSYGPTVDERVKPDISSTGQSVISSVNSFDITQNAFSTTVEFEGETYGFVPFSGTSMSGPMVAGIVALMLEANPSLSAVQAKDILKVTARLDNHTGPIDYATGHLQWGWGKANALAAVTAAETLANLPEITLKESLFNIFPNPAAHWVQVELIASSAEISDIQVVGMDGKVIPVPVDYNFSNATLHVSELPAGIYLIKVMSGNNFSMKRLVKE